MGGLITKSENVTQKKVRSVTSVLDAHDMTTPMSKVRQIKTTARVQSTNKSSMSDNVAPETSLTNLGKRARENEDEDENKKLKQEETNGNGSDSVKQNLDAYKVGLEALAQAIQQSSSQAGNAAAVAAASLVAALNPSNSVGATSSTPSGPSRSSLPAAVSSTGSVSSHIFAHPNTAGADTITLEIVPEKVGLIIGVKGSIVQDIQRRTQSRIHVDQNFPDGVNRQIKISGTPAQIQLATDLIIKVAEEGPMSLNAFAPGAMVTTLIDCPPHLVGRVIGGSGVVIKDIQQRTGAKIQIDQNFPEGVNRKITVTGNPNAVAQATQLVYQVMEHGPSPLPSQGMNNYGVKPPTMPGLNPYQPQYGVPAPSPYGPAGGGDKVLKVIDVQKQFVGRIIGKKGEHVVAIGKASGCQIKIDQDREPCKINITGPASGIPLAEAMIQEVMLNMKLPSPAATQAVAQYQASQAQASMYQQPNYGVVPNYYMQGQPQAMVPNPYGQYGQAAQPAQQSAYPGYGVPGQTAQPAYQSQPYAQAAYPSYQQPAASAYQYQPAAVSAPPSAPKTVWTEYKTDDGRSYWHNSTTNSTQWERPANL